MSDELCANTIRCLSADMVQAANSGHPGAPLGMAGIAHVLWTKTMNYNPGNPNWVRREERSIHTHHDGLLAGVVD